MKAFADELAFLPPSSLRPHKQARTRNGGAAPSLPLPLSLLKRRKQALGATGPNGAGADRDSPLLPSNLFSKLRRRRSLSANRTRAARSRGMRHGGGAYAETSLNDDGGDGESDGGNDGDGNGDGDGDGGGGDGVDDGVDDADADGNGDGDVLIGGDGAEVGQLGKGRRDAIALEAAALGLMEENEAFADPAEDDADVDAEIGVDSTLDEIDEVDHEAEMEQVR
eukprot:6193434-Pleurochrysis_carterae.AAC.1